MFSEQQVAEVREYFSVFNPAPSVELDNQNTDEEAYILIEGGGLSIGRLPHDWPMLGGGSIPGHKYVVFNHEGEESALWHRHLSEAVEEAMKVYAEKLFRRVNDRIVTNALAEEYFSVFNPAPSVELDNQNTDEEAYILIEGGGLSIGRLPHDWPMLGGGSIPGHKYVVFNRWGEESALWHRHLSEAVEEAMKAYAEKLFRRVNDRIVTNALAEEYLAGKHGRKE
jgi:predicted transcriptional regulator YdeE